MKAKRFDKRQPPKGRAPAANQPAGSASPNVGPPLLKGTPQPETGQPGGGRGRVDITGIVPEDIYVDPDLTEGHPGYEESGESQIIPPDRLAGGETAAEIG